VCTHTQNIL